MSKHITRTWKEILEINQEYLNLRAQIQPLIDLMVKTASPENQHLVGTGGLRMLNELNALDGIYKIDVEPVITTKNPETVVGKFDIQRYMNCYTELNSYISKLRIMLSEIESYTGVQNV